MVTLMLVRISDEWEEVTDVSKANDRSRSDDQKRRPSENEATSRPAEFKDTKQEVTAIPQFDLAEQIMAEQRKVAATRRKGPGRKADAPKEGRSEPAALPVEPALLSSEEQKVIAEIVARDIQQLCGGNAADIRR
jgi:hypothetical protein